MSVAGVAVLLIAAFVVCAWSGRTLASHYQDSLEVAAVAAVAGCLLISLFITAGARDGGAWWPEIALGIGMSTGLFAGYFRSGPLR